MNVNAWFFFQLQSNRPFFSVTFCQDEVTEVFTERDDVPSPDLSPDCCSTEPSHDLKQGFVSLCVLFRVKCIFVFDGIPPHKDRIKDPERGLVWSSDVRQTHLGGSVAPPGGSSTP